jgi:hypothetical protein
MQTLKTYMESIKGQAISQTSDILPLFALPYVNSPDKHASFQELFSVRWTIVCHECTILIFFLERMAITITKENDELFRLDILQSAIAAYCQSITEW